MPDFKFRLDAVLTAGFGILNELFHRVKHVVIEFCEVLVVVAEHDGDHVGLRLERLDTLRERQRRHAALHKNIAVLVGLVNDVRPLADALGAALIPDVRQAMRMEDGRAGLAAFGAFLGNAFDRDGILDFRVEPAVVRGRRNDQGIHSFFSFL